MSGQLDASSYIDHLRRIGALPARLNWPPALVVGVGVPNPRRTRRAIATPFGDLAARGDSGVLRTAVVGAPAAAVLAESLGVLGVERVVVVGRAGVLGAGPPEPAVIEVTGAVASDGTSQRYGAHGLLATDAVGFPDAQHAVTATIDTPFLLDDPELAELQRRGVSVVDMELAAIVAAGARYSMTVGGVFVTSDRRQEGLWTPYDPSGVDSGLVSAVRVADELMRGAA